MQEIFPILIDSMWAEITNSLMPPPVTEVYDSISGRTTVEPIEKDQAFKNELIEKLKKDVERSRQITIMLSDSIHKIDKGSGDPLRKHFQLVSFEEARDIDSNGYKIDFSKYRADTMFNLVYASEFKMKEHDVSKEYILSRISFSTILFDKDRTVGVLTCEYICGGLCGIGYQVFIKKVNNKWIIDKIEETWIA